MAAYDVSTGLMFSLVSTGTYSLNKMPRVFIHWPARVVVC